MDDVATCISQLQAQENFVVAWEILECHSKERTQRVLLSNAHWAYIPMIHRAVLKNVGPLLKTKEGTRYKQKKKQSEIE